MQYYDHYQLVFRLVEKRSDRTYAIQNKATGVITTRGTYDIVDMVETGGIVLENAYIRETDEGSILVKKS